MIKEGQSLFRGVKSKAITAAPWCRARAPHTCITQSSLEKGYLVETTRKDKGLYVPY